MNCCAKAARARAPGGAWGLEQGLTVLRLMGAAGVAPDVVTYTALLDAALAEARQLGRGDGENGTSVVGHGRLVFDMMRADGVAPNTVSYTAFIDAAKEDGSPRAVAEAFALYKEMGAERRNRRTYTAMIGAFAKVRRA